MLLILPLQKYRTEAEKRAAAAAIIARLRADGVPPPPSWYDADKVDFVGGIWMSGCKLTEYWKGPPRPEGPINMSPIFVGHAKVYAFGKKWLADRLCTLALHKLGSHLKQHTPESDDLIAIVDLTTFTFGQGSGPAVTDDESDPLQKLVLGYLLEHIEIIEPQDTFAEYLEKGGPFVKKFWQSLQSSMTFLRSRTSSAGV